MLMQSFGFPTGCTLRVLGTVFVARDKTII